MSKQDTYFQFPIHALHFGKKLDDVSHEEKSERLHRVANHTIWTLGVTRMQTAEFGQETAEKEAARLSYKWFDSDNDDHVAAMLGAMAIGWQVGHADNVSLAKNRIPHRAFGERTVRLREDIHREYRVNPNQPWRELAVLSAIYAGIGSKQYARLSYDQIRAMALGYNGIVEYDKHNADGRKRDNRLTVRQTQYTVGRLHERGLFVRVCPNNRHLYYSHKMTAAELGQAIVKKVVSFKAKRAAAAAIDQAVAKQIKQQVAALADQAVADLRKRPAPR